MRPTRNAPPSMPPGHVSNHVCRANRALDAFDARELDSIPEPHATMLASLRAAGEYANRSVELWR
jgi:hypothetical protein